MFCENCGREVSDQAGVCPGCGVSRAVPATGTGGGSTGSTTGLPASGNGSIVAMVVVSMLLFLSSRVFIFFLDVARKFDKEWYYKLLTKNEKIFDDINILLTILTAASYILLCMAIIKLATRRK